jgi:putative ABC transport system substrate-binding protein
MTFLGGAAAWPLAARAQQPGRMRHIGMLLAAYSKTDQAGQTRIATFLRTLSGLGWSDNINVQVDYRWGGAAGGLAPLAAELVQSAPDVSSLPATSH